MFLKILRYIQFSIIFLLMFSPIASAENLTWKVTIISALPSRPDVPTNYCQQFSPDTYVGSAIQLQNQGVKAHNGMLVKYRTEQTEVQNGLFFTAIDATISKQLDPSHSWYTRFYIHLQQLTLHGVADGVWSTPDCKGRLVAEPSS